MNSLTNHLASGSAKVFIGKAITSASQYVLLLLLGRLLGASDTGLYFLGYAILRITNMFGILGLNSAVVKFLPEYLAKERYSSIRNLLKFSILTSFSVSIFFSTAMYFIAPFLSTHVFHDNNLIQILRMFAYCLPIFTLFQILQSSIRSFGLINNLVVYENVIYPIATVILCFLFLNSIPDVKMAVLSIIISLSLSLGYGIYILKRRARSYSPFEDHVIFSAKDILKFSLPLMGAEIIGMMLFWTDTFMLGILLSTSNVGIYSAAIRISLFSNIILVSVNTLFGPIILASLFSQTETRKLETTYKLTVRWGFHISLPIFLVIFLFPKSIMNLFGAEFIEGTTALIILSLGQLVNVSVGAAGYLLIMTGRPYVELKNKIFCIVLNVVLNWYLIPLYGINGAAIASSISLAICNFLRLLQNYSHLKIHPFSYSMFLPFYR